MKFSCFGGALMAALLSAATLFAQTPTPAPCPCGTVAKSATASAPYDWTGTGEAVANKKAELCIKLYAREARSLDVTTASTNLSTNLTAVGLTVNPQKICAGIEIYDDVVIPMVEAFSPGTVLPPIPLPSFCTSSSVHLAPPAVIQGPGLKHYATGLKLPSKEVLEAWHAKDFLLHRALHASLAVSATSELPASYDGRPWNTPVKNQGPCGDCWLHSGVEGAETSNILAGNLATTPSGAPPAVRCRCSSFSTVAGRPTAAAAATTRARCLPFSRAMAGCR